MPIEYVSGDLFANAYCVEAYAHGCNCQGSMGAGIAVGFRERYPEMFEQYRARCKAKPRQFNLGDAWLWRADGQPSVFTLGTQERVWHGGASYEAVEQSLTLMREQADAEGITSVAMPRIGVGYGGLSWRKVKEIVGRVFAGWTGRLVVYEKYVPEDTREADTSPLRHRTSFHVRAVTVVCTDIDKSVRFYQHVLGATLLPADEPTGAAVRWLRLGSLDINLCSNAEQPSRSSFGDDAMYSLWLETDNLEATERLFRENSVT